ncbi:MAG TPA: phasin family protein [Aliidongia sp.]|nr:phasin family protein [Aliidongia sp.]
MSTEPTALPGFAQIQEFWQSTLKQGGAMPNNPSWDGFAGLQAASTHWMSHRQHDLNKAVETFRQMAACKSPTEAMALQQKWFLESSQSLMADWLALMNPGAFGTHSKPRAQTPISANKTPEKTVA